MHALDAHPPSPLSWTGNTPRPKNALSPYNLFSPTGYKTKRMMKTPLPGAERKKEEEC